MKIAMISAATAAIMLMGLAVNNTAKADPPTESYTPDTWIADSDLTGKVIEGAEWAGTQLTVISNGNPESPTLTITMTFTSAFDKPPACEVSVIEEEHGIVVLGQGNVSTSTTSATFTVAYPSTYYKVINAATKSDTDGIRLNFYCDKD